MLGNKNNHKEDRKRAVSVIRAAGYFLPDNIADLTSTYTLHCASVTISSRSLVQEEDACVFDLNIDNDMYMSRQENAEYRIFYSLFLAQKFVDLIFNERTGNYIYENKELVEYHESYPIMIDTFIVGLFVLRELEHLSNTYLNTELTMHKDKVRGLGMDLPDNFVSNIIRKVPTMKGSATFAYFRGLKMSILYGVHAKREYLDGLILPGNNNLSMKHVPNLVEENWQRFKLNSQDKFTPLQLR